MRQANFRTFYFALEEEKVERLLLSRASNRSRNLLQSQFIHKLITVAYGRAYVRVLLQMQGLFQ